ncbi:Acyltransferase easC [Colletotrichum sp. SAR 10_99]|nr:Acyltransferase easC [Colletotrichum sp. SAR 10_99]
MGSVPDVHLLSGIPQLTPLEQISPRGWVRYLFPFQLPQDYDPEAITDIFRRSLQATKDRFPTLACEAVPDPDARQANALKLQKITDHEIEPVIINDLRHSETFTASFEELKAKHFPVSSFSAEVFTRCPIWPAPGQRVPITIVQANFIRGGLILNWNLFHLVGDGQAFYNWIRVWAEETRRAQNLEILDPVGYPDRIYTDRQIAYDSPQTLPKGKAGRLEDHPEYTIVTDPATQLAKIATTNGHVGQIFYLSKDSLEGLKRDAQPKKNDGSFVSTNDALSALIWRSIMAAQFDVSQLDGSENSVYNIAIDGRGRSQPPIHPEAMGSFLGFIQVELPIKKILEADNIAALSLLIRKAIIAMDKDFSGSFINDVVQLVNNQSDLGALIPTSFLDVPGQNCAQTSWEKFKMYDLDWGHALGGKIAAIRSPSCGILNGMQIMYPQHPDGGREMLVGIYEDCLEKLCNDPIWTRYAERR